MCWACNMPYELNEELNSPSRHSPFPILKWGGGGDPEGDPLFSSE